MEDLRQYTNILIRRVYEFAELKHKDQVDKAGKPYIKHLKTVSSNASKFANKLLRTHKYVNYSLDITIKRCYEKELEIVALLHDILEDTDTTIEDIRKEFPELREYVFDAIERMEHKRFDNYLNVYIENIKKNKLAVCVKIADLENNLDITRLDRELDDKDLKRINKYIKARKILLDEINSWETFTKPEINNYCLASYLLE